MTAGTGDTRSTITLRDATQDDLEAVTRIALAGWDRDEQWVYRFPHAKEHPEDNWRCSLYRYAQFFAAMATGEYVIMVAERQTKEESSAPEMIAFSIWQMPGHHIHSAPKPNAAGDSTVSTPPAPELYDRKDANIDRMKAFREVIEQRKTDLMDNVYGEQQLHLMNLVTHPEYWRQGAGQKLIGWGIDKAKHEKLPVTLFASVMGSGLYAKLGFKPIGDMVVQVDGEEEKLFLLGMVLPP